MRSCTCAGGCSPSTTNLQKDEVLNHDKALDFPNTDVYSIRSSIPCPLRLRGHESMELAHARSLRMAPDHLLAGCRRSVFEQDSLWRISWRIRPSSPLALAPPHDGTLGP